MKARGTAISILIWRIVGPAIVVFALGCQPSREDVRHDSAVGSIGSAADAPKLDPDTVGHGGDTAATIEGGQR